MKRIFRVIAFFSLAFPLFPFFSFADNRADFSYLTVDSPVSLYYNNKSLFVAQASFFESLNLPGSQIAGHQLAADMTLAGPRFAMRLSVSGLADANLLSERSMRMANRFELKTASSFGYGNVAFGFSWSLRGERERKMEAASVADSLLSFLKRIFVSHNDSDLNAVESNFALQASYKYADILSLCVYADRVLSLSAQSAVFDGKSFLSSLGFSFSLKAPKYDRIMSLRPVLAELHVSFFNIFSDSPASDMEACLRLMLSAKRSIVIFSGVHFTNFYDVLGASIHIVRVGYEFAGFSIHICLQIPFSTYAGTDGKRYVDLGVAIRYEV